MLKRKLNNEWIIKEYNDFIYECKDFISKTLTRTGKLIIIADTGGGKTYAFISICKALSIKNPNTVYVMACPCRSQNEQNERSYHIKAIVGGKQIDNITVASMVYDKAKELKEYIIKTGKQLVLIIDEAHQIIDSANFRPDAIKELEQLEDIAKLTIHLTATPSKLLELYKYDDKIKFEPVKKKINFIEHSLVTIHNKDIPSQVVKFLNTIGNTALVEINDLEFIKDCYNKITNKKIGIIANTDTLKKVFDEEQYKSLHNDTKNILTSIKNNSVLTKGYDIIFTTSVLECGTNINNIKGEITPVMVILKPNQIDLDRIKQFPARLRNGAKTVFTLIPQANIKFNKQSFKYIINKHHQTKKIKRLNKLNSKKKRFRIKAPITDIEPKQKLFNEIDYVVAKYQKDYQEIFNLLISKFNLQLAKEHISSIIKTDVNKGLHYGVIYIEENKVLIDEKKLVQVKFREYFQQLYYNPKEFNNLIKNTLNAEKFTAFKLKNLATKEDTKTSKELNKKRKEEKDKLTEQTIQALRPFIKEKEFTDINLLEQYLDDEDTVKDMPKDFKDITSLLNKQKTIKKLLKKLYIENISLIDSIKLIINNYENPPTDEKSRAISLNKIVDDYVKRHNYIMRNVMGYSNNLIDEYSIYRNVFDEVMKKRGRLTNKLLIELLHCFNDSKIIKDKKIKEFKEYHKMLEEYETKKKISTANTTKLMKPLEMIYNLSNDKKGYLINSLKNNI